MEVMGIDKCIDGLQTMIDWSDPYEIQDDVLESAIYYLKLIKLQQSVFKVIGADRKVEEVQLEER